MLLPMRVEAAPLAACPARRKTPHRGRHPHGTIDNRRTKREHTFTKHTFRPISERNESGSVDEQSKEPSLMLNALVTLASFFVLGMAGLTMLDTLVANRSKVMAALKGRSLLVDATLTTRPVTIRYAPRA